MSERNGAINDVWQGKYVQKRKKKERGKRETYLKLRLIKKYRTSDRCVLLVLRLQKKREDNKKGMSQQVYGVSRRKNPIQK